MGHPLLQRLNSAAAFHEAATDSAQANECGYVLIKCYLWGPGWAASWGLPTCILNQTVNHN